MSLRIETVSVTPELATVWLGRNARNRNVKQGKVKYAVDMRNGHWRMTGEPIKFDWAGNLLDGQHRLHALILAGVEVDMVVIFGLDPESQDVMDTGAKRSAADALSLHGYKNVTHLASAAGLGLNWLKGGLVSSTQHVSPPYTNTEALDFLRAYPGLVDASHLAQSVRRIPARPSVLTFTAWALATVAADDAREFFLSLAEMRTRGKGDPRFTLLHRLQNAKDRNEALSAISQSWFVFRAWSAHCANVDLQQLKLGNLQGGYAFPTPSDLGWPISYNDAKAA
jgi:hypothetical protein